MSFDPNAPAGADAGIFGLPHGPDDAAVHVLPVPFDATASYGKGAARGPEAVLRASAQVDLLDLVAGDPTPQWKAGIWMAPIDPGVLAWNEAATAAQTAIEQNNAQAEMKQGFSFCCREIASLEM